jgi:hypothetical protein
VFCFFLFADHKKDAVILGIRFEDYYECYEGEEERTEEEEEEFRVHK